MFNLEDIQVQDFGQMGEVVITKDDTLFMKVNAINDKYVPISQLASFTMCGTTAINFHGYFVQMTVLCLCNINKESRFFSLLATFNAFRVICPRYILCCIIR